MCATVELTMMEKLQLIFLWILGRIFIRIVNFLMGNDYLWVETEISSIADVRFVTDPEGRIVLMISTEKIND